MQRGFFEQPKITPDPQERSSSWITRSWNYFSSWIHTATAAEQAMQYPKKPNRYFSYGWNQAYQDCYTDEEVKLLQKIQTKHLVVADQSNAQNPFELKTEKRLYDWWTCQKPLLAFIQEFDSFTLPNREAKDLTAFPLWNFGDNIARQIANWQGIRVKQQQLKLMNDPGMLSLEELKNWFFNSLIEKGCKKEDLEYITKRQSYVKQLLYLLPNFGLDRLYFYEIQSRLNEASNILLNCIANKQLPDLLADIIIKEKSLETTIGTFLHFLLINDEVADNFSDEFTENNPSNCHLSPVCKAYQNAHSAQKVTDQSLSQYQSINQFYELHRSEGENTKINMNLKENILTNINFANFFTAQEKHKYLEAIAAFESLVNIRKTLEDFKNIQANIGTYLFASNYLDSTNTLASNYIALIDKTNKLMDSLLESANRGLKLILQHPQTDPSSYHYFEKNLRSLDTRFTKEMTTHKQLEMNCNKAKDSIQAYQLEMQKLATSLQSGEATREVGVGMQKLVSKIQHVNTLLTAQLNKNEFLLPDETKLSIQANIDDEQINKAKLSLADKIEHEIGTTLSPTFFDRMTAASLQGAAHGLLRGGTNVLGTWLEARGATTKNANLISQFSYYGSLFLSNFYSYYNEPAMTDETNFFPAFYQAVYSTGQLWLLNILLGSVGSLFESTSNRLSNNKLSVMGKGLKQFGSLTRFGVFAYNAHHQGFTATSVAMLSGTVAETVVEQTGKRLLKF